MNVVIATFNRADPGPYDRDIQMTYDTEYDGYRLRFARASEFWVNPARRRYKSRELRTLFLSEADACAHMARTYKNFEPRVEIGN
jgi:hypothetical protein